MGRKELSRMRIGFTLVELLIVILIVGILTGIMVLSATSTTDSAKASIVISNLRNVKAAGFLWFSSNINSTDVELTNEWTDANMREHMLNYFYDRRIYDYEFIRIPGLGYLIGEPNVLSSVINRAIMQKPGFTLFDDNGVAFVYPVPEGNATVCIKVK